MDPLRDQLRTMFVASDDPWGFRSRWYEARKRALTLACLPAARYRRGFEPGCANGELLAALATRCDALIGSDGIAEAVALARARVADQPQVEVAVGWVPDDWPAGDFDLIVVSELGYYLDDAQLAAVACQARAALGDDGSFLACHWRHPIEGCARTGDAVHRLLHEALGLPRVVHHEERDLVLDVWSADRRSVAEHEGLVSN